MGWSIIRQAFKNADMRKRIFAVVGMIVIYRALAHVPVPLADPSQLRQFIDSAFNSQDLLGFIDVLNGGALQNFSIMLMGLGPYITASIILQLLAKAVPKLEEIQKDGESGRRKIATYTRWLTLPLGIVQSIGLILFIQFFATSTLGIDIGESASIFDWALMIVSLTAGAMLLMWLGELMTEQGVGNGISVLIVAGVISQLPSIVNSFITALAVPEGSFSLFGLATIDINLTILLLMIGLLLLSLLLTYGIVKLNEAQRAITISYAKRVQGNKAYGGVDSVLPIKLIAAGVIPIIFASALIAVPAFLGQVFSNAESTRLRDFGVNLTEWFGAATTGGHSSSGASFVYAAVLFALVVMFTFFYTNLQFNPKEISEDLQKQGGFIAGIRPGKQTEDYLKKINSRLTLYGALALASISALPAIVPTILTYITNLNFQNTNLTIGGTSLIIVVSVGIETIRQIESRALMISYDTVGDDEN